jgi:transposase
MWAPHQSGRPKLINDKQKRNIARKITSGQIDTAVDVQKDLVERHGVKMSAEAVRRAQRITRSTSSIVKPSN